MLVFIMKIIVTPLAVAEGWCRMITAFLLWDKRPMEGDFLMDIIWKNRK